jgi:hypothetical protein
MAKNQNQSGGNKKPAAPKEFVMLFGTNVRLGERKVRLRAIVMDAQHHLLAGVPVDFLVNGRSQLGTYITGQDGAVECDVPLPTSQEALESMTFQAKTGLATSENKPLDLSKYKTAIGPGEVEVFLEEVKHGPGDHTYYVAVVDRLTRRPSTQMVVVIPHALGAIEIDNICRFGPYRMEVNANGEIIRVKTNHPGRNEIDLIPPVFPDGKKQIVIYGPAHVALQVSPTNRSGLAKVCNGFV